MADQAADSSEGEGEHGEHLAGDRRIAPGQPEQPGHPTTGAASASSALERSHDVKESHEAGEEHSKGDESVHEFPVLADARVGELVVETEWRGKGQKHNEGDPRQGIAVEPPARLFGNEHVPGNVGRQEPEIDDRVSRKPEQDPRHQRIGALHDAQRPGNHHKQHL